MDYMYNYQATCWNILSQSRNGPIGNCNHPVVKKILTRVEMQGPCGAWNNQECETLCQKFTQLTVLKTRKILPVALRVTYTERHRQLDLKNAKLSFNMTF